MTDSVALLAAHLPTMDLLLIAVLSSLVPISFAFWLMAWLGKAKDGNADEEVAQQAKADKAHRASHGGHDHGNDHDHDHHGHAHA